MEGLRPALPNLSTSIRRTRSVWFGVRDGAAYGLPGEVVLGKGLSEQKAPLAAILLALQSILAAKIQLSGQVVFLCCVSGETGRQPLEQDVLGGGGEL